MSAEPERVRMEIVPAGPVTGTLLDEYKEQVRLVVNTEFVPRHYRGNPYACLAAMMYGREIGLAPMESLNEVYMVDGKPGLSAKAMVKRARQFGHSISGEGDDQKATVTGRRADTGDEMTVTYTIDMAKRAGYLSKAGSGWHKTPEDMLWARAVSRLCRRLFSDAFGALPYGPEELEEIPEDRLAGALNQLPPDDTVVEHADDFAQGSGEAPTPLAAASPEPITSEFEAEQQSLADLAPKDVQEDLKKARRRKS